MKRESGRLFDKQRVWGDMNNSDHKQSRRFLKYIDVSFLICVIKESTWVCALLDILSNKEELLGNWKAGGSLGCSEHEMLEFRILRGENRTKSMVTVLNFRKSDFDLFRYPLGRILWELVLERRGPEELVHVQELPSSSSRNFHPHVLEFNQRQSVACMAEGRCS